MAKGFIGASGCKAYLGAIKMRKGYIGATRVYSAGNIVAYHVDTGVTYQEEVDEGASCLAPKTFTPAISGWEFAGWRQDTAANGNVLSSLAMGDAPITLYAVFRKSVTVTYYNGNTTKATTSGYRYYNNGTIVNPTFTLTQTALSGWTARGWSTSTAGNGGISFNNGVAFTWDGNVTLYGMYQQAVTLTYYNCSTSAASTSGTRYYNPGSGGVVNPTFTLTPATLSGWTFRGWATSSVATAGIAYSNISGTAFAASTTVYAAYYQTITLSYNGNGSTSGSTAAQTGTRYWNTGNISNPSFTLRSNGFSRSGYTFSKWAFGNTGGTQYAAGASVTLSASTIMYAVWIGISHYFTPLNSVTWTITDQYGLNLKLTTSADAVKLTCLKPDYGVAAGYINAKASIPTGGCSKVRLIVSKSEWAKITVFCGGKSISDDAQGTRTQNMEFDIAGETVEINLHLSEATEYFTAQLALTSIYFYN